MSYNTQQPKKIFPSNIESIIDGQSKRIESNKRMLEIWQFSTFLGTKKRASFHLNVMNGVSSQDKT